MAHISSARGNTTAHHIGVVDRPYWLVGASGKGVGRKWQPAPCMTAIGKSLGSWLRCTRPGSQVLDVMPIGVARQVREWMLVLQTDKPHAA